MQGENLSTVIKYFLQRYEKAPAVVIWLKHLLFNMFLTGDSIYSLTTKNYSNNIYNQ